MYKLICFVTVLVALTEGFPALVSEELTLGKVADVVHVLPSAFSHQSQTVVHARSNSVSDIVEAAIAAEKSVAVIEDTPAAVVGATDSAATIDVPAAKEKTADVTTESPMFVDAATEPTPVADPKSISTSDDLATVVAAADSIDAASKDPKVADTNVAPVADASTASDTVNAEADVALAPVAYTAATPSVIASAPVVASAPVAYAAVAPSLIAPATVVAPAPVAYSAIAPSVISPATVGGPTVIVPPSEISFHGTPLIKSLAAAASLQTYLETPVAIVH